MDQEQFNSEMERMLGRIEAVKAATGVDFIVVGLDKSSLKGLQKGQMSEPCLGVVSTMPDDQVDELINMLAHARK